MSSNSLENSENICVVCFRNVDIYSIGNCDHMVCYECSTRMRVLCRQNECPICRQDLPKVFFTYSIKPFSEIINSSFYEDKKFKIHFQDKNIRDAFYKLLEHACSVCPKNLFFKTFQNLYDHMRREHELFYCDLCVENLKIFTSERKCYTKADLAQHRRKGDPDDRSHRGHPLCEFCQVRYMDNDFLYRHLRKDHLFCHFCDADGHDLYYSSYDYLRDHFQKEHYLCEEGECIEEKFTPVFRTEIDLKAHRMSVHGKTMGKAAAKQARTLELEFTLKPRTRQQESRKGKFAYFDSSCSSEGAASSSEERARNTSPTLDLSEFPFLPSGSGSATVAVPQRRGRSTGFNIQALGRKNAPLAITDENFPVLGESNDSTVGTSARVNINQDRSNSNNILTTPRNVTTPTLATPRNVSIHVNQKSNAEQNIRITQDDFPALSSNSKTPSIPAAKWVSVLNKKPISNPAPKQEKQSLIEGDISGLNYKFKTNLNLKASEPLKPNYVNIRSIKEEANHTKKSSSVPLPVQSESLDESKATSSGVKVKVKKKKSKTNTEEERTDTAKKKDDVTPKKTLKADSSNTTQNPNASLKKTETDALVKVAEDWFEINKKSKSKKEKDEDINDFCVTSVRQNNKVSSGITNCSSTNITRCTDVESDSTNCDNSIFVRKLDKTAPPGFDHLNGLAKNNNLSKPPPGFAFDFPCSNGLTFTNSRGQNVAISTNYIYITPLNFEKRNQNLVTRVFQILLNDGNLELFKKMSALFRQDMLSGEEYYNHCIKTMGEESCQEIFPELLVLLPDINKQQELFQVFSRCAKFDTEKTDLTTCETCRQVLCNSDIKEHKAQHALQEHFPLLMPSEWNK